MVRSFLYVPLSAALVLSAVTGSFASVNAGAANSLISSLYSLPASAGRDALIAQVQGLSSACNASVVRNCLNALDNMVSTAQALGLPGSVAGQVAALARDTAATTPGVTSDPEYIRVAQNIDGLGPTNPTGAVGPTGATPAGDTGGPGGGNGGGDFSPFDRSPSPGSAG